MTASTPIAPRRPQTPSPTRNPSTPAPRDSTSPAISTPPAVPAASPGGRSGIRCHNYDGHEDSQSPEANKAKSAVSLAKLLAAPKQGLRLDEFLASIHPDLQFSEKLEDLEKECDWFAIIHADGNGLGQIFLDFGEFIATPQSSTRDSTLPSNARFVKQLREFSLALDLCTEKAFRSAVNQLLVREKGHLPTPLIIPIVLGGDDLTVITDGRTALRFTRDFLAAFEEETGKPQEAFGTIVADIAQSRLGAPRLSACAGIAIVKPHYPFSSAYDLAEELIRSAKLVKKYVVRTGSKAPWPCSVMDFHVLYDSTVSELDEIRGRRDGDRFEGRLIVDDGRSKLFAKPYVVTDPATLKNVEAAGVEWAKRHSWAELEKRVRAILAEEDGRRVIPNSQLHDLRAGLFHSKDVANERLNLIRHRYNSAQASLNDLEEQPGMLFFDETDYRGVTYAATRLLDAMDAANFWGREAKLTEQKGAGK